MGQLTDTIPESDANPDASFKAQLAIAIEGSSQQMVEEGLASEVWNHDLNRFLSPDHPQLLNPGTDYAYKEDESDQAKAFIAASCLAHYGDSWSYFAQAVRAIMAGELTVAKHLIYYSELRSAFSILARQGILIRSGHHLVLQNDGSVVSIGRMGTHEAVWLALKAWMKTSGAKEFFLGRTKLGGQPVSSWLEAQGAFAGETMEQIFRAVGYDLKNLSDDRKRRNSASYGARFLSPEPAVPMESYFASEVQEMWDLLEPAGSSGFDRIDADLAAYIVMSATKKQKKSIKRDRYTPYVLNLAESVGSDQPASTVELLVEVAERAEAESLIGLALAKSDGDAVANPDLRSMVARSFLLARFAAGGAEDLLMKSGVSSRSLDFWFANIGLHSGLWSKRVPAQSTMEILDQIREDVSVLFDNNDSRDLYGFLGGAAGSLHRATDFGLVAVWIRGDFEDELPVLRT